MGIGGEKTFGDEGKPHGKTGCEGRPRQGCARPLELNFSFESDGLVDDMRANRDTLLNFLLFAAAGDRWRGRSCFGLLFVLFRFWDGRWGLMRGDTGEDGGI